MISIIIPIFNRADLLPETLNSILNQSDANWECILVDDGSTDATWTVLQNYVAKDPRFRIFKRQDFNKPKGANACRNLGIEKSKGEYLLFFDSDDLMMENAISDHHKFIDQHHSDLNILQSVYFGVESLNMKKIVSGDIHSPNLVEEFFRKETVWITHNPVVSKSFLNQHHIVFNESLKAAQDWEFFIKILVRNPKITSFENIGTQMRIHNESISSNEEGKALKYFHYYKARNLIFNDYLSENQRNNLKDYYKDYSTNLLRELIKMQKYDWAKEIIINETDGKKRLINLSFLQLYKTTKKGLSKIDLS